MRKSEVERNGSGSYRILGFNVWDENYQVQLLRDANTGWPKSHPRVDVENVVSGVKWLLCHPVRRRCGWCWCYWNKRVCCNAVGYQQCARSQELSHLCIRIGLTVEWKLNGFSGELSCYVPLINFVLREQKARGIWMFLSTVWNINHGHVTFFCQRFFQESR